MEVRMPEERICGAGFAYNEDMTVTTIWRRRNQEFNIQFDCISSNFNIANVITGHRERKIDPGTKLHSDSWPIFLPTLTNGTTRLTSPCRENASRPLPARPSTRIDTAMQSRHHHTAHRICPARTRTHIISSSTRSRLISRHWRAGIRTLQPCMSPTHAPGRDSSELTILISQRQGP